MPKTSIKAVKRLDTPPLETDSSLDSDSLKITEENLKSLEVCKFAENSKTRPFGSIASHKDGDNDGSSSYMLSQNGSPFKKMRRTREERKRLNILVGKKENDQTLNISPVKKSSVMEHSVFTPNKD